jgi:putative chitinase
MDKSTGFLGIHRELLRNLCPQLTLRSSAMHAEALNSALQNSTIVTDRRLAAFLGQILVETNRLRSLVESLQYTTPARLDAIFSAVRGEYDAKQLIAAGEQAIANRVYANRLGNGDEASGDGWRYRGSGYLCLTGRENFDRIGKITGLPLVEQPDLCRLPKTAAEVSVAFWDRKGLSSMADIGDIDRITRSIAGNAMTAARERRNETARVLSKLYHSFV